MADCPLQIIKCWQCRNTLYALTSDLFQQPSIKMSAPGHLNFAQEKEFLMFPSETFPYFATLTSGRKPDGVVSWLWNQASPRSSSIIFGSIKTL